MDFGEFLWALLYFYFIFFYFIILFRVISDLFSDHETSGIAKAGWIIFLLLLPFISLIVYIITRGQAMTQRSIAQAQAAQAAQEDYIRQVSARPSGGAGPAEQIEKAQALLSSGAITQAEFDALKAKALA